MAATRRASAVAAPALAVSPAATRLDAVFSFPGSGHAWLAALQDPSAPLPKEPALVWVAVNGERMFRARLAQAQ